MFGAIGVGVWYLYENWATFFPSAAAAPATPPAPATGTNAGSPATAPAGTSTSGGSTSNTGSGSSGTPVTPQTLASIYSALAAAAAASFAGGNPAITQPSGTALFATPDVFNYFLAQVLTAPPKTSPYGWPPDVTQVWPGIDRTQAMPITQYWSGMSSYLSSQLGMSGLGRLRGLRGLGCASPYERAYVTPNNPANGGYFIQ